jgi:hypothetical protein
MKAKEETMIKLSTALRLWECAAKVEEAYAEFQTVIDENHLSQEEIDALYSTIARSARRKLEQRTK